MKASSTPSRPAHRPWRPGLALTVLALAAIAAYAWSWRVPFLFDDAPAIERNLTIRQLWPLGQVLSPPESAAGATGRPLVNLSLALNYAAGGLDPRGYHLFNLAVHVAAVLALFGLVRRTLLLPPLRERYATEALPFAFWAAALWAVHPLLTESVVCVIQRNEVMVSLFYILTLYCFARSLSAEKATRWLTLAVGACVFGMATKEVMATAPVVVLLYDRTFGAGSFREAWRRRWRFYLTLATTWILLGSLIEQHHQRAGIVGFGLGVGPWEYLLTQCRALAIYWGLAAWPSSLVLDYGPDMVRSLSEVWWEGGLVIALLAGSVVALWRRPVLGFVSASFFVILAPSSSFVPLTTQPIAEHRMYLPLAALVVLAVAGVRWLGGRWSGAVLAALTVILAYVTMTRVDQYGSEVAIWEDTIAKQPGNARAHASLGNALARQAQWEAALPHYAEAIRLRPDYADAQSDFAAMLLKLGRAESALPHLEAALRLKPSDPDIQFNLAVAQAQAGHLPEAMVSLQMVLHQHPGFAAAWNNLGDLLLKTGRQAEAVTAFERALRANPDFVAAHNNDGVALAALRRRTEAIQHFSAAVGLAPDNVEIRSNLADALLQSGDLAGAGREYEEALRRQPQLASLHYNLGNVWLQMNRLPDAVVRYQEALRLEPGFAAAHHNLGLALVRLGRPNEALAHYEETLRQVPGSAAAHQNLAIALAQLGRIDEALAHVEAALRIQPDFPAAKELNQQLRSRR